MSKRESAVLVRQLDKLMKGEETEITFPAAITDDQAEEDRIAGNPSKVGYSRRLVLAAQARDSECLLRLARKEPEAFCEMLQNVHHFAEHAAGVLEVARSSEARLTLVGLVADVDLVDKALGRLKPKRRAWRSGKRHTRKERRA